MREELRKPWEQIDALKNFLPENLIGRIQDLERAGAVDLAISFQVQTLSSEKHSLQHVKDFHVQETP